MTRVVANEKASGTFEIPVYWKVRSNIRVQADTLEEAYKWAVENAENIPIDYDTWDSVDEYYQIDDYEKAEDIRMD